MTCKYSAAVPYLVYTESNYLTFCYAIDFPRSLKYHIEHQSPYLVRVVIRDVTNVTHSVFLLQVLNGRLKCFSTAR